MKHHLPKKAKDIKGKVAIAELRRAHAIIVILAMAFAAMMTFLLVSAGELFHGALIVVAIVLLLLLAVISLVTILALDTRKR